MKYKLLALDIDGTLFVGHSTAVPFVLHARHEGVK